jgi:hypothetical protein
MRVLATLSEGPLNGKAFGGRTGVTVEHFGAQT